MDEAMQQTLIVAAIFAVGVPIVLYVLFGIWASVAKR